MQSNMITTLERNWMFPAAIALGFVVQFTSVVIAPIVVSILALLPCFVNTNSHESELRDTLIPVAICICLIWLFWFPIHGVKLVWLFR
jgi:amino acid permease